ncbi:MAG TPA: secretin N-terminal domain-containing protein [Planctomycetota bacterium]|nr:secretin N-terminal domain-containing protein [Planctomycetota bacterium]
MRLPVLVLSLVLFACVSSSAQTPEVKQVTITITKDEQVSQFLDAAALLVGKPILYDPVSQKLQRGSTMGVDVIHAVPPGKELDLVRAILAFYEITLVPIGPKGYEMYLAIDSRSTNNLVKNKAEFVPYENLEQHADRDGFYIMTSIPVRYVENLTLLRTALSTMVTPAGIGRVHEVPGSNRIVVMDYAPTVVAMARLVKELDVEPQPVVTQTIVLQHAEASALAATLKELFMGEVPKPDPRQQQMPSRTGVLPRIAAYEPRNAIVVVATESDLARIREVVNQLDIPPAG